MRLLRLLAAAAAAAGAAAGAGVAGHATSGGSLSAKSDEMAGHAITGGSLSAKSDEQLSIEFAEMVPFYLALGFASILGTAAVIAVSRRVRDHPSAIILIITLVDLLYTLKYMVGALAWLLGQRDERASFHLIDDDCVSSLAYGQFMGMASISWNAVWTYDFLCVLANPLRRTDGQRRWYHVFVWTTCVVTTIYVLAAGVNEGSNNHTCWVRADNANSLIFEKSCSNRSYGRRMAYQATQPAFPRIRARVWSGRVDCDGMQQQRVLCSHNSPHTSGQTVRGTRSSGVCVSLCVDKTAGF